MSLASGLKQHLQQPRFWLDVTLVALLYLAAQWYPLVRVVAIVASLDLLSFLLFHLVANKHSLRLQGFLGGFVSSTAVFVHVLNAEQYRSVPSPLISATLLYALTAMLLECVLIILLLASHAPPLFYLPFLVSIAVFVAAAIWFERGKTSAIAMPLAPLASVSERPVAWFSVVKFSAVILGLILLLEYLAEEFIFSTNLSAMLIALFEAHAVLAASVSEWSQSGNTDTVMTLFLLILLGNTLGKSLLVWRSQNLTRKLPLQAVLWVTYAVTLGMTVSIIR